MAPTEPLDGGTPPGSNLGLILAGLAAAVLAVAAIGFIGVRHCAELGIPACDGPVAAPNRPDPQVPAPSTEAAPEPVADFDPSTAQLGTCLVNQGTDQSPRLRAAACTDPDSYRIVRSITGPSIPESAGGGFDAGTARVVCDGVNHDTWYGLNALDDELDVFLCLLRTA